MLKTKVNKNTFYYVRKWFIGFPVRFKRRCKYLYLYLKQSGKCLNCGSKMEFPKMTEFFGTEILSNSLRKNLATLEHVKRKTEGGDHRLNNLILLCWICNHWKGEVDADQKQSPFSILVKYKLSK